MASCESGDVDSGSPWDLDQLFLDLAFEVRTTLLIELVPLVVGHHQGASGIDDLLDDTDVLLGDGLFGINQHDGHLGLFQCCLGTQRSVEVGSASLVNPAPNTGRVHEAPGLAAELYQLVDWVAGGSGNLVDDYAVLPRQPVEQTGFADIGTAHQCHSARAAAGVGVTDRRELGQDVENGVQDVTTAPTVQGRDRPRLAEAERPQHRRVRFRALVVDLVGDQADRL